MEWVSEYIIATWEIWEVLSENPFWQNWLVILNKFFVQLSLIAWHKLSVDTLPTEICEEIKELWALKSDMVQKLVSCAHTRY
jgi:hypothetical protein